MQCPEVADSLTNWKQTDPILKVHDDLLDATRREVGITQMRQRTGLNDSARYSQSSRGKFLDQRIRTEGLVEADHLDSDPIDLVQRLSSRYAKRCSICPVPN